MAALPIVKREISVKNTFIVADEGEELEAVKIHQRGARTCVARLSEQASCHFGEDGDGISDASDERTPTFEYASVCDRGLSDAETFASTPRGSKQDCDIWHVASSELPTNESAAGLPVRERISLDLSVPPAARRQVMIQIPIELPHNVESLPNGAFATVMNSHVVRDAEYTTIDLRLALNSSLVSSPAPAQPVVACASPAIQACTPNSWPLGVLPFPAAKAMKASSPPSKTSPSADKAVCCHWKNKGWCKYQESCKFLHPDHKRGVGAVKMRLPFPASRPSRRQP